MQTTLEEFIDREADYHAWVIEHPDGFVLNAQRKPKASYMQLHTAKCRTVTHYRRHQVKDAFTGGGYIKVCSESAGALLVWMASYGAMNFTALCSTCKPEISGIDQAAVQEAILATEARELMAAPAKLQQ